MRVLNNHSAPLTVGRVGIAPGAEADLSEDAAKLAGVQAWLKSGKLAEAKGHEPQKPSKPTSKAGTGAKPDTGAKADNK